MSAQRAQVFTDAEMRVRDARAAVMAKHVLFRRLVIRTRVIESRGVKTMSTDGKSMWFNPDWVMEQEREHISGVVLHETLHCALLHHDRMGQRDQFLWNVACDYKVNEIVIECGYTLPKDALMDPSYAAMNVEQVYEILREQQQQEQQQEQQQQSMGGGDDDSDSDDAGDDDETDEQDDDEQDDDDGEADAEADADDASDEPGSVGGKQAPDVGGMGSFQAPSQSADECEQDASEWRNAMAQAVMSGVGSLPATLKREVDRVMKPRMDWRAILREWATARADDDYTWSRPNRRFVGSGLYLPAVHSEKIGWLAFVVDASGSMDRDALNTAGAYLQQIVDDVGFEGLRVFVHEEHTIGKFDIESTDDVVSVFNEKVEGGGGTAFAPTMMDIINDDETFAGVIWFTDMDTGDWGEIRDPGVPVLWLDCNRWSTPREVPFGDVLPMQQFD